MEWNSRPLPLEPPLPLPLPSPFPPHSSARAPDIALVTDRDEECCLKSLLFEGFLVSLTCKIVYEMKRMKSWVEKEKERMGRDGIFTILSPFKLLVSIWREKWEPMWKWTRVIVFIHMFPCSIWSMREREKTRLKIMFDGETNIARQRGNW